MTLYTNLKHVKPLNGGGRDCWAAAVVWLHRIRTRECWKGCGLKPVTSVAVASPPHSVLRRKARRWRICRGYTPDGQPSVCRISKKQLALRADGFILHLLPCLLTLFSLVRFQQPLGFGLLNTHTHTAFNMHGSHTSHRKCSSARHMRA